MVRKISLLVVTSMVGACALPSGLPPLNRSLVQVAPMQPPPSVVTARPSTPAPQSAIVREYDDTLDLSRYSVTTHRGKYFLWIEKPRLTFFVVSPGRQLDSLPAVVYLIFRTQSPQEVSDSRLQLVCDGVTTLAGGVPTARVVPGMLTTSLYQTFELPLATFRQFAACGTGSVSVGGVEASFSAAQFGELAELTAALPN